MIDLASAPTRSRPASPPAPAAVWANPGRVPFDVTITLPGGRAYHARAEMAVMLGSAPAGNPDRLTVQLPPASLDATARLIGDYAARGLPRARSRLARHARLRAAGRAGYLRRARLTPPEIGPVHLEFQVSHHVPERVFVVTALLSWHAQAELARCPPGRPAGTNRRLMV